MTVRMLIPALLLALIGCASRTVSSASMRPSTRPTELSDPILIPALEAACVPPVGWSAQPPKGSKDHAHRVWLSPTGNTAYGVIRFALPLPVGPDGALWGFLREMRRTEGEARLISKQRDAAGLKFVAEGGLYVVRTNLTTRGFRGWAVYAGTLRGREIVHNELTLAELARDNTETGVDGNPRPARP